MLRAILWMSTAECTWGKCLIRVTILLIQPVVPAGNPLQELDEVLAVGTSGDTGIGEVPKIELACVVCGRYFTVNG
jgi:hypothetical protein